VGIPNKDYREDCDRAIYLRGVINQSLVDEVLPQINRLRLASVEPITVYIDSPGGSIALAETIRRMVKAPHPDGDECRLITAVIGIAASAAADFLALGDYAIAYPHTQILYHGSRTDTAGVVTYESATSLDFHFGSQKRSVKRLVRLYGPLLLGDSEKAEYDNLTVNGPDKQEWLGEKIGHKIQPLWYFMVSLCRRLQSADYDLSPEEAYWLGLVDEVPGSDLPNLRIFIENKDRPAPQSDKVDSLPA